MFKLIYNLSEVNQYPTMKDATKAFIDKVKESIANKELSWQLLETACWVENKGQVISFYEIRDFAINQKWMSKGGEWLVEHN